jgi:type III restriction enzyme
METTITAPQATAIYRYLLKNDYIDDNDKPTDTYKNAIANGTLAPLPDEVAHMRETIHKLVRSTYDADALKDMISNGNQSKVQDNKLNENFAKKEFQALWNLINHKYAYTVEFDSDELIKNAIAAIDHDLYVTKLTYTVSIGEQKNEIDAEEIKNGMSFKTAKTRTDTLRTSASDSIKYDLLGKIVANTLLTRKTVAKILQGINPQKFAMYAANPEEFINKVSKYINEQKASLIVDHITYNLIDGNFDSDIFTESKSVMEYKLAYRAEKHIRDYVFVDGINKTSSVEHNFAMALDNASEVCVYAKLPRGFYIPTPVGNYSPDWAIAFHEGTVKHIYFVAETKGSLDSLQLRAVEKAKIDCAKQLFNKMSNSKVRYENVTNYQDLLDKINALA